MFFFMEVKELSGILLAEIFFSGFIGFATLFCPKLCKREKLTMIFFHM